MADTQRYVQDGLGTGGDDGLTPAGALRTSKQGVEYNAFNPATPNNMWFRRGADATMAAIWNPADDGSAPFPIRNIGWPRPSIPNTTITQADWTNGSTTVDNIVGITCDRTKHQGRYATAPDGCQRLITRVIDANTVIIDREYAGATVTTTAGKFQIEADEEYSWRPQAGIDAGWDADAIDLPVIDGNNGAYYIYHNSDTWYEYRNLELRDCNGTYGSIRSRLGVLYLLGTLFHQDQDDPCLTFSGQGVNYMTRCILEGSGAGANQAGIAHAAGAVGYLKDVAIYNMGARGIQPNNTPAQFFLDNVNIGIEIANSGDDMGVALGGKIEGKDVSLGGTNGYVDFSGGDSASVVRIENFQKELGVNKTFFSGGEHISVDVSGEVPNKKLSDIVLRITPNIDLEVLNKDQRVRILVGIINMDAGSQTIPFWVYNNMGETLNSGDPELDFYFEIGYVDSFGDVTAYTRIKANSTQQDIADAADADDWDLITLTPTVAVESLAHINLVWSKYSAAGTFFIEPQTGAIA